MRRKIVLKIEAGEDLWKGEPVTIREGKAYRARSSNEENNHVSGEEVLE